MIRLLILTSLSTVFKGNTVAAATSSSMSIRTMDFEVFGRVQGVFFRKYTKEQAEKLDLRGWCKNTDQGTVQGHVEGSPEKVETMMHWLKNTGSPSSKIEKAEFKNQKDIADYTFDNFRIVKD